MKMFIAAVALATASAIALPANSQDAPKSRHKAPRTKVSRQQAPVQPYLRQTEPRAHSPHPEWDVYRSNGDYAGSDPDPRIRSMLLRDYPYDNK
jgi:hypothetical protein